MALLEDDVPLSLSVSGRKNMASLDDPFALSDELMSDTGCGIQDAG